MVDLDFLKGAFNVLLAIGVGLKEPDRAVHALASRDLLDRIQFVERFHEAALRRHHDRIDLFFACAGFRFFSMWAFI